MENELSNNDDKMAFKHIKKLTNSFKPSTLPTKSNTEIIVRDFSDYYTKLFSNDFKRDLPEDTMEIKKATSRVQSTPSTLDEIEQFISSFKRNEASHPTKIFVEMIQF